jgi:uncharacterized protein
VTCTTCGASLETTATTCPVCGASLTAHDPDTSERADATELADATEQADAPEGPDTPEQADAPEIADTPEPAEAPEGPDAPERPGGGSWSPPPGEGGWSPPPGEGGPSMPSGGGNWSPPPEALPVGGGGWSPPPGGGSWSPPPGAGQPAWGPAQPHPSGLSSEVRNWGLAAHLSAYVGAWIALAFIGPLVVWLLKREDHPFIDHHAKEALNFNLSFLLYGIVGTVIAVPLGLLTLGIGLIPLVVVAVVLVLAWLILPILAAVKAANGEGYRYPFTIRFVS